MLTLVLTQVMAGAAQAGGDYKRHGPGYSNGYHKSHGSHYKRHREHYAGRRGHGRERGDHGYGHRHDDSDKYDYLLGGLLIGGAATYLLSQPQYVERQTVVYRTAPAQYSTGYRHTSGYNTGYRKYPQHGGHSCCDHDSRSSYPVHPIDEKYLAKCTSNVRAGPSTRYHVIDQVRTRELVTVIGKVRGRNWYKVRVGYGIGYIHAPLLEPAYYGQNRYGEAPTETYLTSSGRYCREYRTHVEVGQRMQKAYGTACRQPDGTWQIQ